MINLWPPIFVEKPPLLISSLPWRLESSIAQFLASQVNCLWLSSCWPAFAPEHSRDIIAGGFKAWVFIEEQDHVLHLTPADTDGLDQPQSQYQPLPAMPDTWMAAQFPDQTGLNLQPNIASPGWYGGLSYGYNQKNIGLVSPVKKSNHWPNGQLGFATWVITLDHVLGSATLCTYGLTAADRTSLEALWVQSLISLHSKPDIQDASCLTLNVSPWQATLTKQAYAQGFKRIQDYINAGDAYQVNYTQRFDATWDGHPLAGFLRLKHASPSPYAAFWATPYGTVLSQSPELLLQTYETTMAKTKVVTAITKPIKGTAPRHQAQDLDQLAAEQLRQCPKNRAENTMIVDLLRNDLSRYAQPGSMQVNKLCSIESFAHIHHLVSEIQTNIQNDVTPLQVLLACFPGGSITGAPKRRAMEIINALESTSRDIYCGTIGFWDAANNTIFNITIRTLLFHPATGSVHIWAGGGLVKDSTLDAEYQECFDKIQTLMDALQANPDKT